MKAVWLWLISSLFALVLFFAHLVDLESKAIDSELQEHSEQQLSRGTTPTESEHLPYIRRFNRVYAGLLLSLWCCGTGVLYLARRKNPDAPAASPLAAPPAAGPAIWTAARLRTLAKQLFGHRTLCIIANREPYIHNLNDGVVELISPASGLVTAVEPTVRACSGVWIAAGTGTADRQTSDSRGILRVPPESPEYTLKRVWLSPEEEAGYYYGFANEGLWPLCHLAHQRPQFRSSDWDMYVSVNEKFADALVDTVDEADPVVWIQDYHFALLAQKIRLKLPHATTSLFWHIPWPNPDVFEICPYKEELLLGMLGADLIGFHIQNHCNNFLDAADRFLESRVDREEFAVTVKGHTTYVRPFPISVEWPSRFEIPRQEFGRVREEILRGLGLDDSVRLGIGVDRLDYTKGLLERLSALELFFEKNPRWVGKFVFVQIAAPSRSQLPGYRDFKAKVKEQVARINQRFCAHSGQNMQVVLRLAHHRPEEVFRFYQASDVCIVTSLDDGMNLVAKEYVSSRSDCGGTLVLSSFTGAARELLDAFIVNPYDTDQVADAILQAVELPEQERAERMGRMREAVATNNVYTWASGVLEQIDHITKIQESLKKE